MVQVEPLARGEQTRQRLLDVARERFARDGYRATSVAAICRDAGVGGTTAFIYFANKEALFLAAVDDDVASMTAEFVERLTALADRGLILDAVLSTVEDLVGHHPLARRLLGGLEPEFTPRVLESDALTALPSEIVPMLEQGQRDGSVRPDLPLDELARGLVGVILSVTLASVQIGPAVHQVVGPGIAVVLRGLLSADPRLL